MRSGSRHRPSLDSRRGREELKLTLEYDGTGFRGWARQPGERTVEGVAARGARRGLPGVERARGRRADRHRRARDGPGRERPGRRRAAAGAGGGGAQRGPAGRRRRRRGRGGGGRLQRPLLGALARLPLPDPPAPRPLPVRGRAARSGGRGRSTATRWTPPRRCCRATHDFTAFTPTETQHRLFEPTVLAAAWEEHGDELHFTIDAESFLRHMVRTLVGTMLEGRLSRARGPSAQRGRRDRAGLLRAAPDRTTRPIRPMTLAPRPIAAAGPDRSSPDDRVVSWPTRATAPSATRESDARPQAVLATSLSPRRRSIERCASRSSSSTSTAP